MKTRILLSVFFMALAPFIRAQNHNKVFEPTLESMSYLMTHVDSNKWNEKLNQFGLKVSKEKNENQVEYKRQTDEIYQYVGYDIQYGVLTVVWKDASGKKGISTALRKELKGKEYNAPSTYKINYGGVDYIIGIEIKKDKGVYEMITMEVERK